MSEISAKEPPHALPLQRPGVSRRADASVWLGSEAVEASANRCQGLTGPARSMCYKAVYDITY
jgi:hypothetical protein